MNCITYLSSEYPAISHTFIYREVTVLRSSGYCVNTASINYPKYSEKFDSTLQEETGRTLYIKKKNVFKVFLLMIDFSCRHPRRLFHILGFINKELYKKKISSISCLAYFIEAIILNDWMTRMGSEHLHVHFGNPASTVAMLVAELGKIDFSMSIHGPDVFFNIDNNLLGLKVEKAKAVRCISHFSKSQLLRISSPKWHHKFHIIHCGVDLKEFSNDSKRNHNLINMLCVGRLVPAKGQIILLKAFKEIIKSNKDIRLTLIGDGPDKNNLYEFVKTNDLTDYVNFRGALGQFDVRQAYRDADIFVLPSFAEGVPVVLMEAMAMEIPVVSTIINGIPELIENGVEGVLVFPSDEESLKNKILELIANEKLRDMLGQCGRNKVKEEFDIWINGAKMVNFFRNIGCHE